MKRDFHTFRARSASASVGRAAIWLPDQVQQFLLHLILKHGFGFGGDSHVECERHLVSSFLTWHPSATLICGI
jgi:hypothetical protein